MLVLAGRPVLLDQTLVKTTMRLGASLSIERPYPLFPGRSCTFLCVLFNSSSARLLKTTTLPTI